MKISNLVKKFGEEEIIQIIKENYNLEEVCMKLFGYRNGQVSKVVKEFISQYEVDTSHFDKQYKNRVHSLFERTCPQCGITFETDTKDDKQTCSHQCSNIYFSQKRLEKIEGTKKVKCSVCEKEIEVDKRTTPFYVKCSKCKKEIIDYRTNNGLVYRVDSKRCEGCNKPLLKNNKSGYCKDCLPFSERHREKIRKAQKRIIEEGRHKGWKTRYKLEPSYPEKYFIDVWENENVNYRREVKIGKYFADFLLPNNIIIEVDGKQHRNDPDRIRRDIEKDNFLESQGYKVIRIDWFNPSNKLYSQIDNFFDFFYNQFIDSI